MSLRPHLMGIQFNGRSILNLDLSFNQKKAKRKETVVYLDSSESLADLQRCLFRFAFTIQKTRTLFVFVILNYSSSLKKSNWLSFSMKRS